MTEPLLLAGDLKANQQVHVCSLSEASKRVPTLQHVDEAAVVQLREVQNSGNIPSSSKDARRDWLHLLVREYLGQRLGFLVYVPLPCSPSP